MKCKKQQLTLNGALSHIRMYYNIERSIAICKGKLVKHELL